MSEDTNTLPDDDEAQRLLDELAAEEAVAQEEKPKAAKKKAPRKKAAKPEQPKAESEPEQPKAESEPEQPKAESEPETEGQTITNATPRKLGIMHVTLAPGECHTLTELDQENDRFMRKVARAIELGVLE